MNVCLQVCDAHIARQLQQLADSETSSSAAFLERVNECWQDHCSQMLTIRSIFLYLDRTYVIADSSVKSIFDLGLQLFRMHLATHPQVCAKPDIKLDTVKVETLHAMVSSIAQHSTCYASMHSTAHAQDLHSHVCQKLDPPR